MDEYNKFLDDLKMKASITDVVSSYSPLVRKGGHYFCCCPLHVEKTPSFCLYENTNTFYCYGCHKQGDVISFIQDIEKTDFKGAVEFLANKYNMEVPKMKKGENFSANKKKRDRLYQLTRTTGLYYHENLIGPKGVKALEYLHNRGISDETIKVFGLGYSVSPYDLPKYLSSHGFTAEEMVEARVAYKKANGTLVDPQAERFVTPIINSTKNIVAFGGRIIEKKDPNVAKYYNSMESFIFHKSHELFGQNLVKNIRNLDSIVLVEGYMDVISLYQAGIKNAVASMGTALTIDQAKLIKRFASKVVFMYDGDSAGQKGMQRGVDILKEAGLDVFVVVLENDMDPDEYIRKFGSTKLQEKIASPIPMYQYKIDVIEKESDMKSPEGRGKFAANAINVIKDIPNITQIEPLLRLIERKTAISSDYLVQQLNLARKGQASKIVIDGKKEDLNKQVKAIRFILFAAFGGVEGLKIEDEFYDCIKMPEHKQLYDVFRANEGELTLDDLESLIEDNKEVENILNEGKTVLDAEKAKIYYKDCRKQVLKQYVEERRKQLTTELDTSKDPKVVQQLMNQLAQINDYAKRIK